MFSVLLVVFLIVEVPTPSSGFGMMKGGGSSSSVGEILAAGLITGMLMNNKPSPVMQALRHPMLGGYGFMHSRHAMPHMLAPRIPLMSQYDMVYRPVVYHRPQYVMNQALITEVNRHQALASRLNEEIRALEAQESILEAYLARVQKGAEPGLNELLDQEDTIPAAALLLGTELMDTEGEIENAHVHAHAHAQPQMPHPEMYQVAGSEPDSRYILPRIVRHFVQRLIRRAENH